MQGPRAAIFALATAIGLVAGAWATLSWNDDPPADPAAWEPQGPADLVAPDTAAGVARLAELRHDPLILRSNVTINVVLVGLNPDWVDFDAVEAQLPKDYSPSIAFSQPRPDGLRSGLQQRISYDLHVAPDAFADALFAEYARHERAVEIPQLLGPAGGFLQRYDGLYQLGRTASGTVHLINATAIETWIWLHREDYGLAFPDPEYTVFFLDSYSKHRLWADEYYWYEFTDNMYETPAARNMRAWGGTYDFLFMDYSAAPNDELFDNVGIANADPFGPGVTPVPVPAPEGTAYNDPPTWHYADDGHARIGKGPLEKDVTMTDRITHALDVAINLRILGDYLYPPLYHPTYRIHVHLFHDGRSTIPKDDLDRFLDRDLLHASLQAQVPWSRVEVALDTYVLPGDDAGMDLALTRAKAEGGATYIPTSPITDHVDAQDAQYRGADAGTQDILALLFLLEGHYTFVLPLVVGGVSLESTDGLGWGTISSVNDYGYQVRDGDARAVATDLTGINAHELGHNFGLFHAHDGYRRTADGYAPLGDHTWSTTATVMSYRLRPMTIDTLHRDHLARGHTLWALEATLRDAHATYRALAAVGVDTMPQQAIAWFQQIGDGYNEAVRLHEAGQYQEALGSAIAARNTALAAYESTNAVERSETVATWTTTGVNAVGAKASAATFRAAVAPSEIQFDVRAFTLSEDAQRLTVRVTWQNSPTSWGDFFAAWYPEERRYYIRTGAAPLDPYLSIEGGIHDHVDEGPLDANNEIVFTLDLDAFPSLRNGRTIHVGAGTRGAAVDGAYTVEIVVAYRDPGDGAIPTASSPSEESASAGPVPAPAPWPLDLASSGASASNDSRMVVPVSLMASTRARPSPWR